MEEITVAAIRLENGDIVSTSRPGRHHTIFMDWDTRTGEVMPFGDQGFLTTKGRFVDREEAWIIAEKAKQLIERAPTGSHGTLYSEDLW